MDPTSIGLLGASSTLVLGLLYKVYKAINHKQCKSDCMGVKVHASFDVSDIIHDPIQHDIQPEPIIYVSPSIIPKNSPKNSPESHSDIYTPRSVYIPSRLVSPLSLNDRGDNKETKGISYEDDTK